MWPVAEGLVHSLVPSVGSMNISLTEHFLSVVSGETG